MPGYKTHLIAGTCAAMGMHAFLASNTPYLAPPLSALPLFCLCSLLGSIFPDIDIPSKMQRIFYKTACVIIIIAIMQQSPTTLSIITFFIILIPFIKHRTITHHPLFIILFPCALLAYVPHTDSSFFTSGFIAYLFFIIGAISHIMLDRIQSLYQQLKK